MSILSARIPVKHKTFRELELDFINMVVGYHLNYHHAFFYDFEKDVLGKLAPTTNRPFAIISSVGPNSSEFVDLVVSSGISFHNRFINILKYTITYFDNKLDNVSVDDLLYIPSITPYKARQYHWVIRERDDPIRLNTVLLSEPRLKMMESLGVNIKGNLRDPDIYNRLELTYLELMSNKPEY